MLSHTELRRSLLAVAVIVAIVSWSRYWHRASQPVDDPPGILATLANAPKTEIQYYRRMGTLYCGNCHIPMGNWDTIRDAGEANEGGLRRFMLDMVEGGIMPPSEWHREQLKRILDEEGPGR
jgi:hypothetical protein